MAGTDREPWVMPDWMEQYRDLINNTGGNSVEDLLNDRETTARSNVVRAGLIIAVHSQVGLLYALRKLGLLGDRQR